MITSTNIDKLYDSKKCNECDYFIKKNGKLVTFKCKNYMRRQDYFFFCILKNIKFFEQIIYPSPSLSLHNEEKKYHVYQLYNYLKLYSLKNKNNENALLYYNLDVPKLLQKKYGKNYFMSTSTISPIFKLFFQKKHMDNVLLILFLDYITDINTKINKFFGENILTKLSTLYLYRKLYRNSKLINDKQNFYSIFYEKYIYMIQDEIKQKYKKTYDEFDNFHDLYNFLNKKGYVKLYYKTYVPQMIANYPSFLKKLVTHPDFNGFKKTMIKSGLFKHFYQIDDKKMDK